MIEEKLKEKEAAKKAEINQGILALQDAINNYEPNLDDKVKLAEHEALDRIIGLAIATKVGVNELGLIRNLGKKPKEKKADAPERRKAQRARQF